MAIINKNKWSSLESALIDFSIEFENDISVENIFLFVENVMSICDLYSICKIDLTKEGTSYLDHLKFTWNNLGYISPFSLAGYKFYSNQFSSPITTLSFYSKDTIVEKKIAQICNSKNNPAYITIENRNGFYCFNPVGLEQTKWLKNHLVSPISFSMTTIRKGSKNSYIGLSGRVNTDIWLDKVNSLKVWNEEGNDWEFAGDFDNSELALLNTPRLNSFFKSLQNLTQDFNGKWCFETDLDIIGNHAIPINGQANYHEDVNNLTI